MVKLIGVLSKMYQMLCKVAIVTVAVFLSVVFLALGNPPLKAANLKNGEQKYIQNCLICHGVKGLGDGPAAQDMAKKPADINRKLSSLFKKKAQLTHKVLTGKTSMPAFKGVLSVTEIEDIFAYIQNANL